MKLKSLLKTACILLVAFSVAGLAVAKSVKEKYKSGKRKLIYNVNKAGQKHGSYKEYFKNGKLKISCKYNKGKLHGRYTRKSKKGKKVVEKTYKNGELHGVYSTYDKKGKLVSQKEYVYGQARFPMTSKFMKSQINKIARWNPSAQERKDAETERLRLHKDKEIPSNFATNKTYAKDRLAGLRKLMMYRLVCNIPYKHLKLSPKLNAHADGASFICGKIGRLSHTPPNPGLTKKVYDFCYHGTKKSNLSMNWRGTKGDTSIDSFMDDSDPSNIDRVGHRRWCLNPAMGYAGVSSIGKYGALYCFDQSGPDMKAFPADYDFDYITFPASGYMPASKGFFQPHYAWSVSYNKHKYRVPDDDKLEVKLYKASASQCKAKTLEPKGTPLKLSYKGINKDLYGTGPCIIFLPKKIKIKSGACYIVVIEGLIDREGNPATIKYPVMFF